MDTLAVRLYTSSLPRRVRDFHPLERAHGAQTKSCRSYTDLQPSVSLNLCYTMDCFLRGFVGTKCCQTKKAFSMSAESGSWSTHYMRISQKMIKKLPGGHLIRCFQPDIRSIHSSGDGISGFFQFTVDIMGISHIICHLFPKLFFSFLRIHRLSGSLNNVRSSIKLGSMTSCP